MQESLDAGIAPSQQEVHHPKKDLGNRSVPAEKKKYNLNLEPSATFLLHKP